MALELEGKRVHMVPLKSRFVEVGRAREMVRHACQLVAGENPKGLDPHVMERGRISNLLVGKQV